MRSLAFFLDAGNGGSNRPEGLSVDFATYMYYFLYITIRKAKLMQAITYTQARQSLAQTMAEVCEGHEPVIITRQKAPAVVMVSLEDYNSIKETSYLLSNPANVERLLGSVVDAEAGKLTRVSLQDLAAL